MAQHLWAEVQLPPCRRFQIQRPHVRQNVATIALVPYCI